MKFCSSSCPFLYASRMFVLSGSIWVECVCVCVCVRKHKEGEVKGDSPQVVSLLNYTHALQGFRSHKVSGQHRTM